MSSSCWLLLDCRVSVRPTSTKPTSFETCSRSQVRQWAWWGGSVFSLRISLELLEAPTLDAAALALPVAAVGAVTGAWAGGWMAGVALRGRPGPLLAIAEGAGLGLLAGIFVGASTIATCAVLSFPRLLDRFEDLDEAGTASTPEISSPSDVLGYVSLAVFLGGGRGAGIGLISGAILFPLISLYMGF